MKAQNTNFRRALRFYFPFTSQRVGIPEEFGLKPGDISTGQLVAALKEIGFDLVLDTNTAADLTIMEEGTELLHRIKARTDADGTTALDNPNALESPLPMFTSCCPGWMAFIEKSEPELAPFISTCKSPHVSFLLLDATGVSAVGVATTSFLTTPSFVLVVGCFVER